MGGQHHVPAALPPGKTRYPLCRSLGGPQSRSGQVLKISPALRFDPRVAQPVASRYTDWGFPVHLPWHISPYKAMWNVVVSSIVPTSGDTYRLLGSKCRRPDVTEDKPHDIVRGYYMSCVWCGIRGGMWRSFRCHDVTMATLGAMRGACEGDGREQPTIYCIQLYSLPVSCTKTLSYKKLSWLWRVQVVI